jgi:hypothetical protein
MTNPMVRVHDIESGEVVDRPMTEHELADYEASLASLNAEKQAQENTKMIKIAAYEKLGLTAEEIAAILP